MTQKTDMEEPLLDVKNIDPEPVVQFRAWFEDAQATSLQIPEAMTVATTTKSGRPSARTVLCKGFDQKGFVFFTNYKSQKAKELIDNPVAELLFHWEPLARQVRIFGSVEKITEEESLAYFHTRPRGSQIGAWASPQSQVVESRDQLLNLYREQEEKFGAEEIPLPPFWGGFRVVPVSFEFWQGRNNRFHDRILYRDQENGRWDIVRLAP